MLNCWYMIVAFSLYHVSNAGKLTRQCKKSNGKCGININLSCDGMFGPGWVEMGKCCNSRPCCFESQCEDIQQIPNGTVTKTGTAVGSTATFSCDANFELRGNQSITCTVNGWSDYIPLCYGCPDSIGHFRGSTYLIICRFFSDWISAKTDCESRGGNLTSIETEDENNYLKYLVNLYGVGYYWIGLSDTKTEGSFQWLSSQQLTFTDWYQGPPIQPDDKNDLLLPNADCVVLNDLYSFQWTDEVCTSTTSYGLSICEIWSVFIIYDSRSH